MHFPSADIKSVIILESSWGDTAMKKIISASLVLALTLTALSPLEAVHAADKPAKESKQKEKDKDKAEKEKEKDKDKAEKEQEKDKEKAEKGRETEQEKADKEKAEKELEKAADKAKKEEEKALKESEKLAEEIEKAAGKANAGSPSADLEQIQQAAAAKKAAIQQAVKTKKELIELRQELKKTGEVTDELKAKYEELAKQLEQQSELKEALEVQKELLDRFYKPGDEEIYSRLGELYEKNGQKGLKTFVNGKEVVMADAPFIQNGRTLVPVRAIGNALKADVTWEPETQSVEVKRGDSKIVLFLGSDEALVNGEKIKLETKPVLKNGRVFLPIRFIGEKLNAKVGYQEQGELIIIEDQQAADPVQTEENESSAADAEAAPANESAASPSAEQTTDTPADAANTPESAANEDTTSPDASKEGIS
jgi:chemotaxis protein histidine kinase CheA